MSSLYLSFHTSAVFLLSALCWIWFLGRRIRAVRCFQHLTQEKFAERLEVDTRTVQRWENNEMVPRYCMRAQIQEMEMAMTLHHVHRIFEEEWSYAWPEARQHFMDRPNAEAVTKGEVWSGVCTRLRQEGLEI